MKEKERLFSEFAIPTKQEWLDKIGVDLKGADFQKRLVWRTGEGFEVQPFYQKADIEGIPTKDVLPGDFPCVRGSRKDGNPWHVRQDIKVTNAAEANSKCLEILMNGVDSVCFDLRDIKVTEEVVAQLLKNLYLDCIEINFRISTANALEDAKIIKNALDNCGIEKEKIAGSLGYDPFVATALKGAEGKIECQCADIVELFAEYNNFRPLTVSTLALADKGAMIVQELAYALAWGNEYLDCLVSKGISADVAAKSIRFDMGISTNYFLEIAKVRAAKLLWAQIVNQYEPKCQCACNISINATTTLFNMTMFDSYVNLLRTQTEAMSAAIAGVDSIVVLPFNSPYENPTDFSERIAKNQQLLLKEECHFDKVVDPSAGSYYIETLTASVAKEAWTKFLAIEEKGGFAAVAEAGEVAADIAETNKKRRADAAKRKEFMLGTNQFPNFIEASEGKTSIVDDRLSADFEELRKKTEGAAKQPVAFMLTIGSLAWRQARAQFSSNFLACAGYKIIDNLGFPTVEEGVDAALKANADIVVLCSSDEEYAEFAPQAFKYLNGRAMFVVAGAPECAEDLKAQGIDKFINVRSNVLDTLLQYNAELGI